MEKKQFRDLGLNDKITIELTVADALMACGEYGGTEWSAAGMTILIYKVQLALFDPLVVKEHEAAVQAQRDQQQGIFQHFFTGQPPEVPPNMEEP